MLSNLTAEWFIWRAQKQLARGTPQPAIELLRKALVLSPKRSDIYLQLSKAYQGTQEFDAAEKCLQDAIHQAPDNATFHLFLGQLYYDSKRYQEAKAALEKCLEFQTNNQLARNYLALTSFQLGAKKQAFNEINEVGLANNAELLARFSLLFEKEVIEQPDSFPRPSVPKLQIYQSMLYRLYSLSRSYPLLNSITRYFLLRKCLRLGWRMIYYGNLTEAMEIFNTIREFDPANDDAPFGIGVSLFEMKRYEEAKKLFMELLARQPASPVILVYLGQCYYQLEDYEKALALFERADTGGPEDFGANYYAGLCFLQLKKEQQALDKLRRAFTRYYVDTAENCLRLLMERLNNQAVNKYAGNRQEEKK